MYKYIYIMLVTLNSTRWFSPAENLACVQVKAAILSTLSLLLVRGGIMMKPFLPQLQTTFVKSLSESSKVTRRPLLFVVLTKIVVPIKNCLVQRRAGQHILLDVQGAVLALVVRQ